MTSKSSDDSDPSGVNGSHLDELILPTAVTLASRIGANIRAEKRQEWVSRAWYGQRRDYASHALSLGGNDDLSDICTFIDARRTKEGSHA